MARPTWTRLRCTAPRQTSGKWWLPWRRVELGPVSSHVPWRHSTVTVTTVYPSHWDHYRLCVCVWLYVCVRVLDVYMWHATTHLVTMNPCCTAYQFHFHDLIPPSSSLTITALSCYREHWMICTHCTSTTCWCFITTFPDNLFLFLRLMDSCMRHTPPLHCNPDPLHFQHWLLV